MKKILSGAVIAALLIPGSAIAQAPTAAESIAGVPVIPRTALFGNPEKTQARLSPDGRYVSFIAPSDGVLNVWVAPRSDPAAAKTITSDTKRGIRQHFWAYDNKHVLYLQDEGGDENWHLYATDVATGTTRDLTPYKGVRAQGVALSWKKPNSVVVGLNDRMPEWHDAWEINLLTAKRTLVEQNTQEFSGYEYDLNLKPKLAKKAHTDGDEIFRKAGSKWTSLLRYGHADTQTTDTVAIEGSGGSVLMVSSVGRDKSALVRVELATAKTHVLGASDQADVSNIWVDPRTRAPQAYAVDYLKPEYTVLDKSVQKDVDLLSRELGDGFSVGSRTLDDSVWTVTNDDPQAPPSTYLYERRTGKLTKLFDTRPALMKSPLVPMQALELQARDGLTLVSYLSLPPGSDGNGDGVPEAPVPLVLNVHGGPWGRDDYGFDTEHQWLANRGYAVLSVNFRASTGFGKSFINAGDRQWGAKMHEDLLDAVEWAVKSKITSADKVAIYGGSYGGYATLAGLAFTPDTFACGVDIVGPSNLQTLLGSIPPYWKAFFEEFAVRIGDPRTEDGKKLLTERSPLTRVEAIKKPLLIAQGANDPRVKQAESDQIVKAMKDKTIPVTYVLYPDEGHGFARPTNRTSFYAIAEGFLAQCLGGRYEPVGLDFKGANLQVLEGAQYVPGLPEALN
jgi:dipeptidyl aminopeptidase/acylaminoacyl peptidase